MRNVKGTMRHQSLIFLVDLYERSGRKYWQSFAEIVTPKKETRFRIGSSLLGKLDFRFHEK
jgi:hypothetical protein